MSNNITDNKKKQELDLNEVFRKVKAFFIDLVDLETGLDKEGTIVAIKNNKRMRGANAWLLMCSIMIASLGLDLNSPAVLIGAMLISPLMNPILGIGLSIGINDRETLKISFNNFLIAIIIALITSFVYFKLTPLGELTNEILSRTKPTFLDGLVAIFGGLAGIISASRKDKSNAIPGVAIATALMPPLCVSGFGLATGNYKIFASSFYLFFLNSFFIGMATYIIVRFLRFPFKSFVNDKERRRTQMAIGLFSLLLTIPSAMILFNLFEEIKQKQEIKSYVSSHFGEGKNPSELGHSLIQGDSINKLVIKLIGNNIPPELESEYIQDLQEFKTLQDIKLILIQDSELGLDELKKMESELTDFKQIAERLEQSEIVKSEKDLVIDSLNMQIEAIKSDTIPFYAICQEAKILFPDIENLAFARADYSDLSGKAHKIPVLMVDWERKKSRSSVSKDQEKLYQYTLQRAGLDTLKMVTL